MVEVDPIQDGCESSVKVDRYFGKTIVSVTIIIIIEWGRLNTATGRRDKASALTFVLAWPVFQECILVESDSIVLSDHAVGLGISSNHWREWSL